MRPNLILALILLASASACTSDNTGVGNRVPDGGNAENDGPVASDGSADISPADSAEEPTSDGAAADARAEASIDAGQCDAACPAHSVCQSGACTCDPALPDVIGCGGSCVDGQNDPSNCGGCARGVCHFEVCAAGAPACAPGFAACGGAVGCLGCKDTQSDPNNCGPEHLREAPLKTFALTPLGSFR